MPTFTYTARDRNGNPIQGIMIGSDVNAVREQLRERELFLTSATAQSFSEEAGTRARTRTRRVRIGDMVVMSRQLATLVRAGMPLNECLHTVAQQTENTYMREVVQQVRRDILSGSNFTEAVSKHPTVFPELYVALIRAGEAGGVLDETLETAAEQFDKEAELREKIKAAVTYPIIVVLTAIFVVTVIILFIIPTFARVYEDFKAPLPFVTRLLIDISRWAVTPWIDVVGVVFLLLAWFGTRWYISKPKGRRQWDNLKLRVWIFGKLNRKIAIARFTRTLSAMVRAGVPIIQSLSISGRVANNTIIMDAVARVADFVQQGARLWMPMEQTGQFPPIVTRMIAAGEESGNLDEMLSELTHFYDRDIEYTVQKLTRLMEPLLTCIVGGIVLFVLLALYSPIFNLARVIRKS
ncbi:MAG TPA: type II secretion system F family protein [Chthonomonadaceae bacterium]|nr:type II secretion system F family protein [Chthonomonadaceae bacterium]